jgi:hypothetical protein
LVALQVFRELLQNSDDAHSRAVEIHFETQGHIDRKNGKQSPGETSGGTEKEVLPDLKTAFVRSCLLYENSSKLTERSTRCINGLLEIMELYLEMRIGVD